ncbi:MAG: hypothetical protein PHZ04_03920 [Patescibacteria group bacterium]|nr:hypothetical protein [Patescibacteria group bacterium]
MSSLNEVMRDRLGFLFDCEMDEPFWHLLCGARSVHHLEKLHDRLPANCRLLRDDFVALRKFFQDLPSLMEPKALELKNTLRGTPEEQDKITLYLFSSVYQGKNENLTDYYFRKLHDGRDRFDFQKETRAKLIHGPDVSSGLQSFLVNIFGADFETYCYFSKKTNQIGVSLGIWSSKLTEPLTFQLLSLPKSTFDHYMTGYQGNELVLSYALPAESIRECLGRGRKTTVDVKCGQVGKFCERLKQLLIESGIPAESVTPIIAKR